MNEERKWVDFQTIKEEADVETVLDALSLLDGLERKGDELVGWCPLGKEHGKADSFAMNVEKKSFQCFACKARGSLLDFVRKFEHTEDLRAAAFRIEEIMAAKKERRSEARRAVPNQKSRLKREPTRESPAFVLSFQAACDGVRAKTLDPERLVVLDLEELDWLREYRSEEKSGDRNR